MWQEGLQWIWIMPVSLLPWKISRGRWHTSEIHHSELGRRVCVHTHILRMCVHIYKYMCAHWTHMHTFKHIHEFLITRISSYPPTIFIHIHTSSYAHEHTLVPRNANDHYWTPEVTPSMAQVIRAVGHPPLIIISRPVLRLSGWSDKNEVDGWERDSEVTSGDGFWEI